MPHTEIQTGAVGLFDVLGFRGFLKENKASAAADRVLSLINGLPEAITSPFQKLADGQALSNVLADMKWLVFSDSILVYVPLPSNSTREDQFTRLVIFLSSCLLLNRQMFEFGLPLRGAVDTGTFMIKGMCFAGEPIVNAYDLGRDIDAAAAVLSEDAYKILLNFSDTQGFKNIKPFIPSMIVDYPVPTKSGRPGTAHILNLFAIRIKGASKPIDHDMKQYVLRSFWSHSKPLPDSAKRKAENTEMIFRFLDNKFPNMMAREDLNRPPGDLPKQTTR